MGIKKLMPYAPFLIISGSISIAYGAYKGVLGSKAQTAIWKITGTPKTVSS